jgi:hypothetical protein
MFAKGAKASRPGGHVVKCNAVCTGDGRFLGISRDVPVSRAASAFLLDWRRGFWGLNNIATFAVSTIAGTFH